MFPIFQTGFLINLVSHVTDHQPAVLHCDADTQTYSSAIEKMKMIDKEYENVLRKKKTLKVELAKVKMEEKVQFQKEFEKFKQELARTYEMKTKALNTREKHAIERLQKQQEIEEKNVYMQRQMVLKEIDTLRNRENELKLRMESFEDYQLELKEDYSKRAEQLTMSEKLNKEESIRLQHDSAAMKAKLEEISMMSVVFKGELDAAQQQTCLLRQQNELLRERLESMSDFPNLKEETARLQGQVKLLQKQLVEAQEENGHLRAGQQIHPTLALQVEVRKLQSARKLDEEEFANQKHELQKQLQLEVTHVRVSGSSFSVPYFCME
uniref:Uncharacterized protein n=1 Tax=Hippocampus comes TaxID=109280 RepID=A0A3Q3D519_HIPCM